MRILLHIGIWKTGSTAIQTFLRANRRRLRAQNVLIPEYAADRRSYNHLFERLAARDEEAVDGIIEKIREDAAKFDDPQLVISSEHFWHAPDHVIARTAELLHELSDDVRLLVYLRPQDDMWASIYAQQSKFFRVRSDHPKWGSEGYVGPAIAENALFFHRFLGNYARLFDHKALIVRSYDRKRFAGGDVVSDFLSILDPKDPGALKFQKKDENASFGWKGVVFSTICADRIAEGVSGYDNTKAAQSALRFTVSDVAAKFKDDAWYGRKPECFSLDERREIRAAYAEDNAALFADYFGGEDVFAPPKETVADPMNAEEIPSAELAYAEKRMRLRIQRTEPFFSARRWGRAS